MIYHFYYYITKGQHTKTKTKIEHSIQSETQTRKTKLVNLNPTQN